jgi:hypothetical protein
MDATVPGQWLPWIQSLFHVSCRALCFESMDDLELNPEHHYLTIQNVDSLLPYSALCLLNHP